MALETQELASFAVLAEQLHFGRAATRLHISQPALSKRIRSLEEKIGGPLLVRDRRGVALTPAGAMFYKEARRIIHDLETAFEAVRGASSGELAENTTRRSPSRRGTLGQSGQGKRMKKQAHRADARGRTPSGPTGAKLTSSTSSRRGLAPPRRAREK